jgi:hypothetical protein
VYRCRHNTGIGRTTSGITEIPVHGKKLRTVDAEVDGILKAFVSGNINGTLAGGVIAYTANTATISGKIGISNSIILWEGEFKKKSHSGTYLSG